jgi:hypothetical protein
MERPLTLVIAAATAALAIAPLGLGTQAQAQVDVYIGKQPQQGQLPPSAGPYGDRDRDGVPNRYDNYDNRRGDRYDQYGNRYTRDRDRDGAPDSRNRIDYNDYNPYRR